MTTLIECRRSSSLTNQKTDKNLRLKRKGFDYDGGGGGDRGRSDSNDQRLSNVRRNFHNLDNNNNNNNAEINVDDDDNSEVEVKSNHRNFGVGTNIGDNVEVDDDDGDGEEFEDDFDCPEKFGYYADDRNCSRYHICDHGRAQLKSCDYGLVFSTILKTCDWPYNVQCNLANGDRGSIVL